MVTHCAAYTHGRKRGDISVDDISEFVKQSDTFVWVDLHDPTVQLLQQIQAEFSLHDLAVKDAHAAHQRPKLEEYGQSIFVVLHTAQLIKNTVAFGETHMFIGPRYLVSMHHRSSLEYADVRTRCENDPARLSKGPGFALYALMDFIVDRHQPIVDAFKTRFEKLEADIFKGRLSRDAIGRLYDLKRELVRLRSAVAPLHDICTELMRTDSAVIPGDIKVYFRNIQDRAARIGESIDILREMLTTAMQVNLALITVGQNDAVKRLAGWGAILAIPTMIFSMYGMNFKFMPELDWRIGYPLTMVIVIAGCAGLYYRLKNIGWL